MAQIFNQMSCRDGSRQIDDLKYVNMKSRCRHPNFFLGLITFLILIIGVGLNANGMAGGNYVIGASLLLGVVHWAWSIIDVFKDFRVNSASENRILWIILVVALPPIGGILYYSMSKTVRM